MALVLNPKLAIVAERGLGGALLGGAISAISNDLKIAEISGRLSCELVDVFEVQYKFSDVPIIISVDVQTGTVFKLIAIEGYTGVFEGAVRVGSLVSEVFEADLGFAYDDFENLLLSEKYPGIALELNCSDPSDEVLSRGHVVAISVYLQEVDVRREQT